MKNVKFCFIFGSQLIFFLLRHSFFSSFFPWNFLSQIVVSQIDRNTYMFSLLLRFFFHFWNFRPDFVTEKTLKVLVSNWASLKWGLIETKWQVNYQFCMWKIWETTITSYECMLRKKRRFYVPHGPKITTFYINQRIRSAVTNFWNFIKSRSYEYIALGAF